MTDKQKALAVNTEGLTDLAAANPDPLKITQKDGALVMIGTEGAQQRAFQALGSDCNEFHIYCLSQLAAILPEPGHGKDYSVPLNAALAMLSAIKPANELEAMLAVQMIATNQLALLSMRRASGAQTTEGRQLNGNLATKFSRTFTAQLEALDRHRRGGKQIVEHVHVNDGGQAVFANNVTTGSKGGE
jgi:hypothetical protein